MIRPELDEYAEYYRPYVSLVPDGPIEEALATQIERSIAQLETADAERELYRYAEGKWSVREAVGHLVETERMFTGRALWMARRPGIELPGMDQDAWIVTGDHHNRPLAEHLREWRAVRSSTIELLRGLPAAALEHRGIASEVTFSVRALFWIVAGHELHHRAVFSERYGLSDAVP